MDFQVPVPPRLLILIRAPSVPRNHCLRSTSLSIALELPGSIKFSLYNTHLTSAGYPSRMGSFLLQLIHWEKAEIKF